jgi:hypothetical protein
VQVCHWVGEGDDTLSSSARLPARLTSILQRAWLDSLGGSDDFELLSERRSPWSAAPTEAVEGAVSTAPFEGAPAKRCVRALVSRVGTLPRGHLCSLQRYRRRKRLIARAPRSQNRWSSSHSPIPGSISAAGPVRSAFGPLTELNNTYANSPRGSIEMNVSRLSCRTGDDFTAFRRMTEVGFRSSVASREGSLEAVGRLERCRAPSPGTTAHLHSDTFIAVERRRGRRSKRRQRRGAQ